MSAYKLRIIFFGTPSFAAEILEDLVQHGHEIVAIVTKQDKARGRSSKPLPSAVKEKAHLLQLGVPILQPEKASTKEFCGILGAFQADVFVVVAYGEILNQAILDLPPLGCINVHASLLPKYRGAAPIERAILNGEKESGITIIKMVLKMDAGAILHQKSLAISEEMTALKLREELCDLGKEALQEVLLQMKQGRVEERGQDETEVTYAPKITKNTSQIIWEKSAEEIYNQIRALTPRPGAVAEVVVGDQKSSIKVLWSKIGSFEHQLACREISTGESGNLLIGCGQGVLELIEVQPEGKKKMSAAAWLRGLFSAPSFK